jgi:PAS domain S-box-containing protein
MESADRPGGSLSDENIYRLLVSAITDYAVYMLDPTGIVTSWNPGAQRFKGYTQQEIVGQHFSRFYTEEDRATQLPARALKMASQEGRFENEGWRLRKDGSRFWAHVVIDPIRGDAGELLGFAKITRDLTERRETQHALDLAREQLFQSQKIEALGRLTGGIAHDFNNLLTVVLGSLEMLRKRLPEDPRSLALIENAIQGAKRGASLTQRMLAFARRQELNTQAVDIPSLVHGMSSFLQRSLGPAIIVETRFPLGLASVRTDPNQLESALLNLAVNARDAMPEGGPLIITGREDTPALSDNLPEGRYVCLTVIDSGSGMDADTLSKAVEPFFSTKGIGKGTGLGLPMVQGLVEQSGGRLVMKSRAGEGTEVELWLPVAETDAPGKEETPEPKRRPAASRSLNVLAVDDDSLVLMNTVAMLEDIGHTVFAATSAGEALAILDREKDVDLVITDQAMPHMTGLQLAQAIRKQWPDMPIILATGYAELRGDDGIDLPKLSKPFFQNDLVDAIAAIMLRDDPRGRRVLKFSPRASNA